MKCKLLDKDSLQQTWDDNPLTLVMGIAVFTRLVAALFSRGYGMHDDHFLVVEAAQAWVDKIIVPGRPQVPGGELVADGHSMFYMGLHYLLFKAMDILHLTSPAFKVLIARLLHAVASIFSVWITYKITESVSNKKDAAWASLLMAVFWFMPMLGVRNLAEIASIPFCLLGIWVLLLSENNRHKALMVLLAGFILGTAVSVRFQLAVFAAGVGLVLMLQRKWLETVWLAMGGILSFLTLQGAVDYVIWGKPFAEFEEYVRYNIQAANDYIVGPWYNYLLLLAGILIPPISLMLLFGFFRSWKKQLLLFLPAFLFLVFHSLFPNKQERFIFPIVPFVIMVGVMGWNEFAQHSDFVKHHVLFFKRSLIFFFVLNLILLVPVTVSYSKRSQVEAMSYLSKYKPLKLIIAEDSNYDGVRMLPRFYSGQWPVLAYKSEKRIEQCMVDSVASFQIKDADFVLFYGDKNLNNRVKQMQPDLTNLVFEAKISPGFIDEVMYKLNPVNRNLTIFIYRNQQKWPKAIDNQ